MFFVSVHELRKEKLDSVPSNKPGWYRWWVPKYALKSLLNSPYLTKNYMQELFPYLQKREYNQREYFCVYVGISPGQSIQSRLKKHIMCSFKVSTLRKSIAALLTGRCDEDKTNEGIDNFMVEYWVLDYPIKNE